MLGINYIVSKIFASYISIKLFIADQNNTLTPMNN